GPIEVEAARADWSDATVQFTLTSRDVEALSLVSGAQQQPVAGEEGEPLVVRFTRNGSPVSNVPVQWEVVSGDATVNPQTAPTNGQGLSSVDIVFGEQGGNVLVEARAGTAVPVQFSFFVPGGSGPPPVGVS